MRNYQDFQSQFQQLSEYFKTRENIVAVYLFGSFGTALQTPLSDLDLAVLFDKKVSLMEELRVAGEISSIVKMEKVDLVNLNTASIQIQHEVLYQGEKIYDGRPEKAQEFVENVLEIYHDYEFILRKYREDFREGLAGDYLNG